MATWYHRLSTPLTFVVRRMLYSERFGQRLAQLLCTLDYTGRKTGRRISLLVLYRPTDDGVTINIEMPRRKSWWKNFRGEGGPVTLTFRDGSTRTGHAIAVEDPSGRVDVNVTWDGA